MHHIHGVVGGFPAGAGAPPVVPPDCDEPLAPGALPPVFGTAVGTGATTCGMLSGGLVGFGGGATGATTDVGAAAGAAGAAGATGATAAVADVPPLVAGAATGATVAFVAGAAPPLLAGAAFAPVVGAAAPPSAAANRRTGADDTTATVRATDGLARPDRRGDNRPVARWAGAGRTAAHRTAGRSTAARRARTRPRRPGAIPATVRAARNEDEEHQDNPNS